MAQVMISDVQRRVRLGRRHALAAAHRRSDAAEAARAVVVLHATEAPSVHLAVAARTEGVSVADVDRCLYEERALVKQLAMRRTLFAFPRDLLPAALGSAAPRVGDALRRRIETTVAARGDDPASWLDLVRARVTGALSGRQLSTTEIRTAVPELDFRVDAGSGKWAQSVQVAPWVMSLLGLDGVVTRADAVGSWLNPRPRWALQADWLGGPVTPTTAGEGYAVLVQRWLERFGPGTVDDIVWWLGATKAVVRAALGQLSAVEVRLEDGVSGWVLPGDEADEPDLEPWAALLPALDPTTMGWKERRFYLDPVDRPYLFDTNGNAGTTAWWNGRIVGCWVQDPDGVVRVVARDPLDAEAERVLAGEAARLTAWLDGTVVTSIYASSQQRSQRLG